MLIENDKNILSSTLTFLNHLNKEEQELIINNTILTQYKKGEIISSRDNNCSGILVIKSGRLRTFIISDEGREVTLFRLEENDVCVLSASCMIKTITFDIHIEADVDSTVFMISQSMINQLAKNVYVENFLLNGAVERFSDVMWTMEQILFYKFNKRLAIFLLDETIRNNSLTITVTHDQIAKYLGSAREVVTKMLKYFSKEGLVELTRGEIKVIDKDGLKSLI